MIINMIPLSWIERLATDQKAGGSNPLTHVIEKSRKPRKIKGFWLFFMFFRKTYFVVTCGDKLFLKKSEE